MSGEEKRGSMVWSKRRWNKMRHTKENPIRNWNICNLRSVNGDDTICWVLCDLNLFADGFPIGLPPYFNLISFHSYFSRCLFHYVVVLLALCVLLQLCRALLACFCDCLQFGHYCCYYSIKWNRKYTHTHPLSIHLYNLN